MSEESKKNMGEDPKTNFEELNDKVSGGGFFNEFVLLIKHNKKWWITPIIICLLLFGILIIYSGHSALPFLYPF